MLFELREREFYTKPSVKKREQRKKLGKTQDAYRIPVNEKEKREQRKQQRGRAPVQWDSDQRTQQ